MTGLVNQNLSSTGATLPPVDKLSSNKTDNHTQKYDEETASKAGPTRNAQRGATRCRQGFVPAGMSGAADNQRCRPAPRTGFHRRRWRRGFLFELVAEACDSTSQRVGATDCPAPASASARLMAAA